MIKDFMCQNTDTKNLSYSHSLLYSYLNHPRLFFVLEDKQKQYNTPRNLNKFF